MEEKKDVSTNKSNKSTTIIIVIPLLIILGLGGLVLYQRSLLDKEKANTDSDKKNNPTVEVEQKKFSDEELTGYLKDVPYLPEYTTDNLYDYKEDAYRGEKVTSSDLNEKLLLAHAYRYAERTNTTEEVEASICGKCAANEYVKEEELLRVVKDMYNIDTIKATNFTVAGGGVEFTGGYYATFFARGATKLDRYSKLVKYEIKDNDLVIYEKVLFTASISTNILVLKTTTSDANEALQTFTNNDEASKYALDNIELGNTYKHTFKINSEGKYYWYSSELSN